MQLSKHIRNRDLHRFINYNIHLPFIANLELNLRHLKSWVWKWRENLHQKRNSRKFDDCPRFAHMFIVNKSLQILMISRPKAMIKFIYYISRLTSFNTFINSKLFFVKEYCRLSIKKCRLRLPIFCPHKVYTIFC